MWPWRRTINALLGSVGAALALVGTSHASASDYYVDPAGLGPNGNGQNTYTTVQSAINAVPAGTAANPTRITIYSGTYTEQISVPSNKPYLSLIGQSGNPADTVLTYNLNATSSNGSGGTVGTQGSASTSISAANFSAANITFTNSTPYGIAQAVAFLSGADKTTLINCKFQGYQDTLYLKNGRDYLAHCVVNGTVDYIFGNSTSVFDDCTINNELHAATVTAPNTAPGTAVGYVFRNCQITADAGVGAGTVYLSRPWQYTTADSYTVFLNCGISPTIRAAGWSTWDSGNTNPGGDTRYAEYQSTDLSGKPLSVSGRVSWSHQLTTAQANQFTLDHLLGPGSYWNGWINDSTNGWGPSNYPTVTSYSSWGSGDTWTPSVDPLGPVWVPEPGGAVLGAIALMWAQTSSRRRRRRPHGGLAKPAVLRTRR
jgi:pectinesterase